MQIQISWLLQKPTDLDLHCLLRQGISRFSRTRVNKVVTVVSDTRHSQSNFFSFFLMLHYKLHSNLDLKQGWPQWLSWMHSRLVIRRLWFQSAGSGNILSWRLIMKFSMILPSLPLIQEGQLSVSGKRMCTSTG